MRARRSLRVGPSLQTVPASLSGPGRTRSSLAAWLLLSSLPRGVQDELLDIVELGLDSIEAQAQPVGIDLSSDELRGEMRRLQSRILPSYNAAVHLSAWPWPLGESPHVVVPTRDAPVAATAMVAIPGDGRVASPGERAARFAAWPLSYGLVLATGGAVEVDRLRAALGDALLGVSSPPALLVDVRVQNFDEGLVPSDRLLKIRKRASALPVRIDWTKLSAKYPLEAQLLEGLQGEWPQPPALPWFDLKVGELFIAPKLGSLARRAELWAVVEAAVRRARVRVVRRAG